MQMFLKFSILTQGFLSTAGRTATDASFGLKIGASVGFITLFITLFFTAGNGFAKLVLGFMKSKGRKQDSSLSEKHLRIG